MFQGPKPESMIRQRVLMAFEGLSSRLQEITKKIKGEARITESNMKEMLREVKLALLEADVNYKIVKDFIAKVQEKALGQEVMKSLKPGEQVYFYNNDWGVHMWGQFESYNSGYYKISWRDTTIVINGQTINIPANYHGSVLEEEIK